MLLNFHNVEDLVFFDKVLQKQLPDFQDIFGQWTLGKRVPSLSFLSQRAKFDFLNRLADHHLSIIAKYLNEDVQVEPIDYHVGESCSVPLEELENWLLTRTGFCNNFCLGRDRESIYISFWR